MLPRPEFALPDISTGYSVDKQAHIHESCSIVPAAGGSLAPLFHDGPLLLGSNVTVDGSQLGSKSDGFHFGKYCVIGQSSTLRPCVVPGKDNAQAVIPCTFGSFIWVGDNCVIEASSIGSGCCFGDGCTVGQRAVICENVIICSEAHVSADTVCEPLTVWAGSPACCVGMVPASFANTFPHNLELAFKHATRNSEN